MVIEDNPDDALLIREMMKEEKDGRFAYSHAGTLGTGLQSLRSQKADIVLLDLGLPDCTGLDTLTCFKAEFPNLPAVVMTGLSDEETAGTALGMGAQDYLVKGSMNADMLSRVLRYSIERARADEDLLNSKLLLQRMLDNTVKAMGRLVELRDPYTSGHQQRAAALAAAIAAELKLEQPRIGIIKMAATIHDIGKMYVPSDILSKPGKLSKMELDLIRTHAQSGFDVLSDTDFPEPAARMVLEHHERLDGSGYPGGLQGNEMLLESRILAVADVVEAMASHRPYRAALGIAAAMDELSSNRGRLYDPDAVDACLRLFNENGFSFAEVG
jgi:response regulator RpfG family c-di-GMP phosphodiesterase